ncbi:hypothetical protein F01_500153 [Burkholderia cenocepacia]|nr:hypothetical protein F01_500153 [Burkholderia cenocepacia]
MIRLTGEIFREPQVLKKWAKVRLFGTCCRPNSLKSPPGLEEISFLLCHFLAQVRFFGG